MLLSIRYSYQNEERSFLASHTEEEGEFRELTSRVS